VDLLPVLRDELSAHKAASANAAPNAYVFPSAAGTRQDGGRVRTRVLGKAIKRANGQLAADGQTPLPEGLTLHALRRTCASVLVALGKDPRYVMAQLGHTDPTVTLGIYAQAMTSSDDDRERLRLLVEGGDLAGDDSRRACRVHTHQPRVTCSSPEPCGYSACRARRGKEARLES
jgi:integrase